LNATLNHQIVLAEAPSGRLGVKHFKSVTTEIPPLSPDQVLIRAIYAQVPPAARAVMTNTTAFPLTRPGEGIFTAVVGEVVAGPGGRPGSGGDRDVFRGLRGVLGRTGLTGTARGGRRPAAPPPRRAGP
jgi:NADPH:quinone reductase-like Zn-dependent oxidoreductase